MKVVLSSSIVLLYPSSQLSCDSPWIVRFLETEGETHFFHPLFEEEDEDYISEYLNLQSYVPPYYLSLRYHITEEKFNKNFSVSWSRGKHDKVLIFDLPMYQSFPLMINDWPLLVLYKWGQLSGFRPQLKHDEERRFDISYDDVDKFDDILCFKGIVYAIDRLGKLYNISTNTFRVQKVVIDKPVVKVKSTISGYRKRLVGSIFDETLYLIVRDNFKDELRVYKMIKSYKKKRCWIEVHSFVDNDQVLFLSRVDGYFVIASEFTICNLKNCIIFYDAFPSYFHTSRKVHKKVKVEKEIQVFWLGRNICNFRPISSYPEFPAANIFSPPNWMLQTCQSPFLSDDEETKPRSFSPQLRLKYEKSNSGTSKMNDQKNAEDSDKSPPNFHGQSFPAEKVSNANSTHATPTFVPLACINCSSTVKFKGVDIRAEHLRTLESIWVKHGSLFCEATVHNNNIRACALDLLAELIASLQSTTGRSLTESQADDIRSALFDLKLVGLKVDWLTPTVDKALKLQSNKAVIESRMLLDKKKAQVDKEEKEFLGRIAKVKQEIEEDIACLSAKFPFSEVINLDDCLGGGLF